jgi:hypothetical protein
MAWLRRLFKAVEEGFLSPFLRAVADFTSFFAGADSAELFGLNKLQDANATTIPVVRKSERRVFIGISLAHKILRTNYKEKATHHCFQKVGENGKLIV